MSMSRTATGLLSLFALAFCLRLATVLTLHSYHDAITFEHGEIAENLLAGRGFSVRFLGVEGPTSQQAPILPALLAVCYWLFGPGDPGVLAVQVLQCAAGALTALCVAWLAWSLLPQRRSIGWLAGLGAAAHPAHIYLVTHVQVAVWAALSLTLLLAVVAAPRWQGRWAGAVLVGLIIGAMLLFEPILALVAPIAALAFLQRELTSRRNVREPAAESRRWGAALARVALMGSVALVAVLPWLVRNYYVHGQMCFIKSTFGYAFWQANNPISFGTDKIPKASVEELRLRHDGTLRGMHQALWQARMETLYIDDVLLKPTGYREFQGLSETERSQLLGDRAWRFIRAHPGRYAALCCNRLRYFLLFDETNPKASHPLYRVTTLVWLLLCAAGLLVTRFQWRALWPTYAIFFVIALFHTLTITSARFRLPLEPLTLVWAAAAIDALALRWRAAVTSRSRQAKPHANNWGLARSK